jgi:hypothetical protein
MFLKFLFDTFNLKISENEAIGWAQKNGLVSTSMNFKIQVRNIFKIKK